MSPFGPEVRNSEINARLGVRVLFIVPVAEAPEMTAFDGFESVTVNVLSADCAPPVMVMGTVLTCSPGLKVNNESGTATYSVPAVAVPFDVAAWTVVSVEAGVDKPTVKYIVVVPDAGFTTEALLIESTPPTRTEADAVLPVPPFVDVTELVRLFLGPEVTPVTFTEKVHELLTGIVPPESETLPEPAIAEMLPPPQLPERLFGVATAIPDGSGSVKATPVRPIALAAGLVIVNARLVLPPCKIVAAPNDLDIDGGKTTDVRSFATSFNVLNSPPPDTVAVLVKDDAALFATFTVTVIVG